MMIIFFLVIDKLLEKKIFQNKKSLEPGLNLKPCPKFQYWKPGLDPVGLASVGCTLM